MVWIYIEIAIESDCSVLLAHCFFYRTSRYSIVFVLTLFWGSDLCARS